MFTPRDAACELSHAASVGRYRAPKGDAPWPGAPQRQAWHYVTLNEEQDKTLRANELPARPAPKYHSKEARR